MSSRKSIKSIKSKRGQALLVLIMLLATTITIVLTTSFTSSTNTKNTKLEEDSQRALAAAEAGVSKALSSGSSQDIGTIVGVPGFQGTAELSEVNTKRTFVSPTLSKDEEYTYYLSAYNVAGNTFSNPYNSTLTLYYESANNCLDGALELSIVYDTAPSYKVKRFIADAGNLLGGPYPDPTNNIGQNLAGTVEGTSFNCQTTPIVLTSALFPNPKLLIVKSLFKSTQVGIVGDSTLPSQGRTITSEARSASTGVTKKVVLFQSYPQLPSDFFVTRF